MLLHQVMASRSAVSTRYYRALYDKLLAPELRRSSKHSLFLNVLYKSLKADPSAARVHAFAKRLLQVCVGTSAPKWEFQCDLSTADCLFPL